MLVCQQVVTEKVRIVTGWVNCLYVAGDPVSCSFLLGDYVDARGGLGVPSHHMQRTGFSWFPSPFSCRTQVFCKCTNTY
jgi:hypothetical protein